MILSHDHKFIFICNGKTGSTSIEKALAFAQQGEEYNIGVPGLFVAKHVPPAILKATLPEAIWNEYFKFVFVRNPWDYFVSNWRFNIVEQPYRKERWARRLSSRFSQQRGRQRQAADEIFSVEDVDFLFNSMRRYRGLPGSAGCYQSNWVLSPDGEPLVDFVGHFESLEQDFAKVNRKIGLNLDLPKLNATQRAGYREYFQADSAERVGELWAPDVDNFGYSY